MNKNYHYLVEYLPQRYSATIEQEMNRNKVYSFKNGIIDENTIQSFIKKIKEITTNESEWTICFIPASSKSTTNKRFEKLAKALNERTACKIERSAIFNVYDKESGYLNGKNGNPTDGFGYDLNLIKGKKIILIDDVITRGTTFNNVADFLLRNGAQYVQGLFLAKTINPDWNGIHYSDSDDYDYADDCYDYYDDEDTYERYNGSYAQDVEGWSDQDIDEVFDGDPDAYWNID
jgi:hypoxanthine-guanine phosphoribosyltransferase